MSAVERSVCRQPGCGGPASGICIENFPFEECPHLTVSVEGAGDESYTVPEELDSPQDEYVRTSSGPAFDSAKCDAFLRHQGGIVIAVIAGPEAGKTTLLATLYELARRGLMDQAEFAGSETILGFEQRCYLAREGSSLDVPDTPRTRVSGPQYLHLRLQVDGIYHDLILADRPGENYLKSIDSPSSLREYEEVFRAEHVLLLVDGRELVSNPHPTAAAARRLYRALVENGLRQEQEVHMVVTKADLFSGDDLHMLRVEANELLAELRKRSDRHEVHLQLTGARTRAGEESFGEGVAALVQDLTRKRGDRKFQYLIESESLVGTSTLENLMRRMVARS